MDQQQYQLYLEILKEELIPALGCTEPIAIAYAAAKAREVLGVYPQHMVVACSRNIIKNAKAVTVPNTGGLKGIEASALAGLMGDASREMEVLESLKAEDLKQIHTSLESHMCRVELMDSAANLHLKVQVIHGEDEASVEIIHAHTNIHEILHNRQVVYRQETDMNDFNSVLSDRSRLNVANILEFANEVRLEDVRELLDRQIAFNLEIAEEGLAEAYGAGIGKMLLECYGDDVITKMRAYAAAGSDARMNGCSFPVMTNSGSGNQGMTTSLPVIVYATDMGIDKDRLYRALVLANLVTVHQKTGIGRLSAYCGAVSAACGSGAAVTYLESGRLENIEMTIINTLANVSGIVCDGAKSSCAAKIASSVDAAMMAHHLAMKNIVFEQGAGIVKKNVEKTISAVGRLGREGMRETDVEVLKIMMED